MKHPTQIDDVYRDFSPFYDMICIHQTRPRPSPLISAATYTVNTTNKQAPKNTLSSSLNQSPFFALPALPAWCVGRFEAKRLSAVAKPAERETEAEAEQQALNPHGQHQNHRKGTRHHQQPPPPPQQCSSTICPVGKRSGANRTKRLPWLDLYHVRCRRGPR